MIIDFSAECHTELGLPTIFFFQRKEIVFCRFWDTLYVGPKFYWVFLIHIVPFKKQWLGELRTVH